MDSIHGEAPAIVPRRPTPVHGGPVYVFRNAIYSVGMETFKMHNHPSGAILYHNTSVKAGMPLLLLTNDAVSNCVYGNNLFLGTTDRDSKVTRVD